MFSEHKDPAISSERTWTETSIPFERTTLTWGESKNKSPQGEITSPSWATWRCFTRIFSLRQEDECGRLQYLDRSAPFNIIHEQFLDSVH